MATATPTIRGYGRYRPHVLAPDRATTAGSRCAYSVGPAIRVENRIGEPAANHYLYMASQIALRLVGVETVRSIRARGGGPSARCASSRALGRCLGSHRRLILA
jgi:glutamine synthetase